MSFQGFRTEGDVEAKEPDCLCLTCDMDIHHLGIMSHRAMHRRKGEYCVIQYSDGRTIQHNFTRNRETQ